MDLIPVLFYVFAVVVLSSAAVVVFSKNIMHSAFGLMFTLLGLAGFYVLLLADFLAITQLMIYIGGILVLVIFAVMLTTDLTNLDLKKGMAGKFHLTMAVIAAVVIAVTFIIIFTNTQWLTASYPTDVKGTIDAIGAKLMTDYILAFEVAGILLLVAIVGAAKIARRRK